MTTTQETTGPDWLTPERLTRMAARSAKQDIAEAEQWAAQVVGFVLAVAAHEGYI